MPNIERKQAVAVVEDGSPQERSRHAVDQRPSGVRTPPQTSRTC
jgi:hypothetical protein